MERDGTKAQTRSNNIFENVTFLTRNLEDCESIMLDSIMYHPDSESVHSYAANHCWEYNVADSDSESIMLNSQNVSACLRK